MTKRSLWYVGHVARNIFPKTDSMAEERSQLSTQELPIEQRFERLATRYKALRHQYELTKKALNDTQEELEAVKQNGGASQSLFMVRTSIHHF
jgi:septal ring factor EnvC (AmiA/AmiB activator)